MIAATHRGNPLARAPVALALAAALALGTITPSNADQAAVGRNIILGAAALSLGIILYNDHRERAGGDPVVGYTRGGGVVYADGRIVFPGGVVYFMSNDGRNVCGYGYGYDAPCGPYARAYTWRRDDGYHRGWYRHRDRDRGDDDE